MPPHELHEMNSLWPFVAWSMDVIGPIEPSASNGHKFIFVAIDYFTKYRTTVRTSIWSTPYLLVYGNEVVIPAEVEIPSLKIIQEVGLSNKEWVRARCEELMLIDEKRMVAMCHGQLYQHKMIRAFNKKVRARTFEVGQLVLKCILPHQKDYKGKFAPNWQGPYIVRKVLSRGALIFSEMDGHEWTKPINFDVVKRYYV
ncbi:uncharacterized protein LOC124896248 [Capsicum annuum]|uniref:uncharacterized protein LOC124896248 n=1 Tax=Capsicum annuum TaxID=4072 RepID=UPI001FB17BC0|nr:uncharacterized protein LOC124896248 [Capsicum annuum]